MKDTELHDISHKINLQYSNGKEGKSISWSIATVKNGKKLKKFKLYSN